MRAHLNYKHPLARVASGHCQSHARLRAADTACGACWERAIRDDERFAVESGLPRDADVDPDYIDKIAVDRACGGETVHLTRPELAVAAGRLLARRLSLSAVAARLHVSYDAVYMAVHGCSANAAEAA